MCGAVCGTGNSMNEIIDLTGNSHLSPGQHVKKRPAKEVVQSPQEKKPKSAVLTFEKACEFHNITLPTLAESKSAMKQKTELLKATLPGGIAALQQIMEKMQEVGERIRNSQFEHATEMASYFVAMKVLELDMKETLQVVSNENYQHLNEHDFTMLCVVVIASIDIKEKLIKVSEYLKSNRFTNFIDCNEILRTAEQVHLATEDIQETVSRLSIEPSEEEQVDG